MIGARAGAATISGLTAAALALAAVPPAQAAVIPGWRIVSTHHFGGPSDVTILSTVVSTGRNDAWAFGGTESFGPVPESPVAEHWNGRTWHAVALPPGLVRTIGAASAPAANDVWAVSFPGRFLLHYNGSTWSVARRWAHPPEPTAVTAFSPADVWVFGDPGTWHLHGRTWTKVTGLAASVDSASALSPRDIWAAGGSSGALLRFNGRTWGRVRSKALAGLRLRDVLAVAPGNVWVAAQPASSRSVALVLLHLKGTAWSRVRYPSWPVAPFSLAPDGSGGLWMTNFAVSATSGPTLDHLSATGKWRQYPMPGAGLMFDLTHIPGTASMWGAGYVMTRTRSDAAIWAYGPVG
jgi:hypothetical protein